jgi:4-hydroxy 2-oxovalerate aldolase
MITNIDVTLRDGGYRNGFNFSLDYAFEHARQSVDASFDWVEIAYLKGSFDPTKSTGLTGRGDPDYVRALARHVGPDHIGLIGHPSNLTCGDLAAAYSAGARLIRLCLTASASQSDLALLTAAKDMGYTVCANLTRVSRLTPRQIAELAFRASEAGADVVYLADSNGSLRPSDVGSLVNLVDKITPSAVGLHAHNNLGLALANSLAAVDNGATWIDSSILGMGKGAGNLIAEQWMAYLDRDFAIKCRSVDLGVVLELSDFLAASVAESRPALPMTDLLMGHFDLSIEQREHFRGSHRDSVAAARDLQGVVS